jgi:hypothetical protein
MNLRIQQLAEQATSIIEMVGPEGYTSSYANFDREKFAELIVRECMNVVAKKCASPTAYNALAEYWEVEE